MNTRMITKIGSLSDCMMTTSSYDYDLTGLLIDSLDKLAFQEA